MKDIAINAVKRAAQKSLPFFGKKNKSFRKAEDELVTSVDLECEQIIKNTIISYFPDHNFLGEENGEENKKSRYTWIVDPVDGTVNFSRGIYSYGISLALANNKEIILGVVYNPLLNELFVAEKDKGATLNDNKIHVSDNKNIEHSVVYATELLKSEKYVQPVYRKIKQFRITSTSAYETCLVAAGRTDAFIKITDHPWGFAAACLIVEEAGGKVTNFDNSSWNINSTHLLISNGQVHDELLGLIIK